jgi:hypothetical protein
MLGVNGIDLGVERRLDVRMLGEQIPRPRQQVGRGLVAREQERHRFVAKLAIAHAAAVSLAVLREEQHGEQVAAILPRRAPLGDQAVDRRVEPLAAALEAPRHGDRKTLEQLAEREHAEVERSDRRAERFADLVRLAFDVRVEQRLADDGERVRRHLSRHVEPLAIAPLLRAPRGVRRHRLGVRRDSSAMEGGLREPALPEMQLVLAREQPFTEQHLGAFQAASLVEHPPVRDEHVADPIRIADEDHRLRRDADARDVAVEMRELLEQLERTSDHGQRELAGIALARPGHRAESAAHAGTPRHGGGRHAQTVFSNPRRRQNCT